MIENEKGMWWLIQILVYGAILVTTACESPGASSNELTIAVAASLVLPITEIVSNYEEVSGKQVSIITGSSGKITAQITAGAPYDLFLSADMEYPETLVKQGLTKGRTIVFSQGALVLFGRVGNLSLDLDYLLNDEIKTIAIPNPEVAPYGRAAIQSLQKAGVYEQLKPKLIYGESVGQVNQFLHSGAVDAGITAATFAGVQLEDYSMSQVDTLIYSPIEHGAVVLKGAGAGAESFLEYLMSGEGKEILKRYNR